MTAMLALIAVLDGPADAAVRTFGDCGSMRRVYPNGAARSAYAATHPSPFWIGIRPPVISPAVYTANRRLDRDGDSIACEVGR